MSHRNTLTEKAWAGVVQGLGQPRSQVLSPNRLSLSVSLFLSLALWGRVGENPGKEVWTRQNRMMSVCRSGFSYSDLLEEALAAAMISSFSEFCHQMT